MDPSTSTPDTERLMELVRARIGETEAPSLLDVTVHAVASKRFADIDVSLVSLVAHRYYIPSD